MLRYRLLAFALSTLVIVSPTTAQASSLTGSENIPKYDIVDMSSTKALDDWLSRNVNQNDLNGRYNTLSVGEAHKLAYNVFVGSLPESDNKFIKNPLEPYEHKSEQLDVISIRDTKLDLNKDIDIGLACKILLGYSGIYARDISAYNFEESQIVENVKSTYKNYVYTAYKLGIVSIDTIKSGKISKDKFIQAMYKLDNNLVNRLPIKPYIEAVKVDIDPDIKDQSTVRQELDSALTRVDQFIIEKFNEEGWTFKITEKNLSDYMNITHDYDIAKGLTVYGNKEIGVKKYISLETYTVWHELGHFVMYIYMLEDDSYTELKETYKNIEKSYQDGVEPEKLSNILRNNYCETSVDEYFAEAFKAYYIGVKNVSVREDFKTECPIIYNIIDSFLKENSTKEV